MTPPHNLKSLFEARSVCLIGASADPKKQSGRPLQRLTQHGFSGHVTLVNPRHKTIGEYACYPTVRDLPEPADVALITLPSQLVPDAVRDCGELGIPNAVILSSGFEEIAGSDEIVRQLRTAAKDTGIRIVGPNSVGFWSLPAQLILTLGTAAARESLLEGPVTVLSQSGSIGAACIRLLQDRGIGCRYFVSVGNETDLTIMDFLDYVVDDGTSEVVALFIEGLRDGERLRKIVRKGSPKGMRFVALQVGAHEAGRLATATHTGKMASAKRVYSDVFRQSGVIEVRTVAELIDAAETLAVIDPPPTLSGSSGVGVLAISGGSRALIADACVEHGVPMAEFTSETEAALREIIPHVGYPKNPVDVDGLIFVPTDFRKTIAIVVGDPFVETLLIQYANQSDQQIAEDMAFVSELDIFPRTLLAVSFLGRDTDQALKRSLNARGIVYATDPDAAIKHLSWLYAARPSDTRLVEPTNGRFAADSTTWTRPPPNDWPDVMELLSVHDINVAPWAIFDGKANFSRRLAALKLPVAVKALPEDAAHKTERGLLHLNLETLDAVGAAIAEISTKVGNNRPVLVQEMVGDMVEVLLAARMDPDCGPVLAIGMGGTAVELFDDIAYVSLPASESDILDSIDRLRLRRLLEGFRDKSPRDVDALVRAARGLAHAFLALQPGIQELEINPLCVLPQGQGAVAVDVLVVPATEKI